jgi:polyisoprenoid-binding protein YceI
VRTPALALALTLTSCASLPQATLDVQAPAAKAPSDRVEEYVLAPEQLVVEADVSAAASYTVSFPRSTGKILLDRANALGTVFTIDVDVASATASWQLVADIARDEFLHGAQHPRGAFQSVAMTDAPCDDTPCPPGRYVVFGDLTLHGTTHRISFPLQLTMSECLAETKVEFEIDRQVFGIRNEGPYEPLVSDTVVVRIRATLPLLGRPSTCDAAPAAPE